MLDRGHGGLGDSANEAFEEEIVEEGLSRPSWPYAFCVRVWTMCLIGGYTRDTHVHTSRIRRKNKVVLSSDKK